MSERKVLNKYYPPDFDPTAIPKRKTPKNQQIKIRMMLPMSIRCNTCGEYMYKGKKFNSRKETVQGEDYLGLRIYRFYMKCTRCGSEFTIKTDPKTADYHAEMNCSRNYEPWKSHDLEELERERDEAEGDAMKMLENKTLESKQEMDILDDLDEIKTINAQNANVSIDDLLKLHAQRHTDKLKSAEMEDNLTEDDLKKIKEFEEMKIQRIIDDDDDGNDGNDDDNNADIAENSDDNNHGMDHKNDENNNNNTDESDTLIKEKNDKNVENVSKFDNDQSVSSETEKRGTKRKSTDDGFSLLDNIVKVSSEINKKRKKKKKKDNGKKKSDQSGAVSSLVGIASYESD